jgi:hypothetical protein
MAPLPAGVVLGQKNGSLDQKVDSPEDPDRQLPSREYVRLRDGESVTHPVFKTGRAEQPSAWMVRFHRRSVGRKACTAATFSHGSVGVGRLGPSLAKVEIAVCGDF